MLKLLLVRHGLTQWNQEKRYLGSSDIPLNAVGKKDAHSLSERLLSESIDQIISSELIRAIDTATQIAAGREISVVIDARLNEINFGVFEGLTFSEAQSKYPKMLNTWLKDYDLPPDNGQSFSSFSETVIDFMDYVKTIDEEKTILIVSHGGVIREILRLTLELPQEKHWSFKIDPASLTEIQFNEGHATLIKLNDTNHLREE